MWKSIARTALFVIGACVLTAASCEQEPPTPDPEPQAAMCGGIAGLACAGPSTFCAKPLGSCGTPDAAGTCQPKPEVCPANFDPVCGCDGNTYGNACNAAAAGANVASAGACGSSGGGQTCGGILGAVCSNSNEFCNIVNGSCGAADQTGTCTPRPEVCTREFVPVCGCDGNTYGNACNAAAAGISVASQGECTAL